MAAGDLNGDGRADLAVTNYGTQNVSVLLALGNSKTTPQDTPLTLTGISVADVDAGGDDINVSLTVGHGSLALASTANLTNVTGDTDGGDGTLSLTGSQADINAAIASLTYTPNAGYNGTDNLGIAVNDLGHDGAGGPRIDTDNLALTITPAGMLLWDGTGGSGADATPIANLLGITPFWASDFIVA